MKLYQLFVAQQRNKAAAQVRKHGAHSLNAAMCADYVPCVEISANNVQQAASMLAANTYASNITNWCAITHFLGASQVGDIIFDPQTHTTYVIAPSKFPFLALPRLVKINHNVLALYAQTLCAA